MNKFNTYKQSKAKRIFDIMKLKPYGLFNSSTICSRFNSMYKDKIEHQQASTILHRIFTKNIILRTKTELRYGYIYSLKNLKGINKIYDKYLLPYNFKNNKEIMNLITKNEFNKLTTNHELKDYLVLDSGFFNKYPVDYLLTDQAKKFIAINIGFLMCDGHIKNDLDQINYFFNRKKDAELFRHHFLTIFNKEKISLRYASYCYSVGSCNKNLATLFYNLGVPMGNKVCQQFLIPNWIYDGYDYIKLAFLSTIYGNEGSKPHNNVWRVQFVISKNKEYVPNLLEFLNQIRTMLKHFGISTSHIQLRKQKRRNFHGRFYISGKENIIKFYNKIGFLYASEKQEKLESLIFKGKT